MDADILKIKIIHLLSPRSATFLQRYLDKTWIWKPVMYGSRWYEEPISGIFFGGCSTNPELPMELPLVSEFHTAVKHVLLLECPSPNPFVLSQNSKHVSIKVSLLLLFSRYVESNGITYVIVSSNQYVSAWRAKIIT